jgi:hypothetical protein
MRFALLLLLAGCVDTQDDDAVPVGQIEQHETGSPVSTCYFSGATEWCSDGWTQKWCTAPAWGDGWDYTRCTWSGWSGGIYCNGQGWQWANNHRHCP